MTDYPRLSDLDTSHPQVAAAVQAARDWGAEKMLGNEGISLILSGPNGVGKTHIAQSILWSMRYRPEGLEGIQVPIGRFYLASQLIIGMEPYRGDTGPMMHPDPSYFSGDAPIIVIDDIGGQVSMPYISADRQAEEIHARYFVFVDHCINRVVHQWTGDEISAVPFPPSLIFTTNLSLSGGIDSEFARHVGGRVWDRLQEICPIGMMVSMHGVPSYRVKIGGR